MKLLDTLLVPPPEVSLSAAQEITKQHFGLDGSCKFLGGERDCNFLVTTAGGSFVLKVANPSEPDELLEMQCRALQHIQGQDPDLPVAKLIQPANGRDWARHTTGTVSLRVRLYEYLPGVTLDRVSPDPLLMQNLGQTLARLDLAMRSFFHPGAGHALAWNTQIIDQLQSLASHIGDARERELAESVIDRFTSFVKPRLAACRAQVIHNDVSFHNSVVDPQHALEISGIFDFGDMVYAPLVQEIATTAGEIGAICNAPLSRAAEIIAGYHSITPLEDLEFNLLPDLISARLVLSILIDSWSLDETHWQDDREHLPEWRNRVISTLGLIEDTGQEEFENLIRSTCGVMPELAAGDPGNPDALQRRNQYLGNASYISYDIPVHLARGQGVWLYDSAGKAYLDVYNNVPHAGHCHPRIVSAIARQTATLNTNTRYLYDVINDYAQRLTDTLPGALDTCFFVSSGSEANDLAWRLATAVTGNSGGLVLENAYHGITEAVYHLSPEGGEFDTEPGHIAWINAPDDYRGPWKRDDPGRGEKYAGYCQDAIQRLAGKGHHPAALYIDMIMSSSGIFSPAPGYLEHLFADVRKAGGLCVADEVQSGFGRTGEQMWGFQAGDVVPDIVTFGKPIAGGYPMGLVVTTREIARKFGAKHAFFSTTGGNPVACAAALAMLEVIEDEGLVENARNVGTKLATELRSLSDRHSLIGDVRGSGLFIGVELVSDRDSLQPASEETHRIVNALKENQVLVGIDGPHRNVLKIRPPMVFSESHADILVARLDQALSR